MQDKNVVIQTLDVETDIFFISSFYFQYSINDSKYRLPVNFELEVRKKVHLESIRFRKLLS